MIIIIISHSSFLQISRFIRFTYMREICYYLCLLRQQTHTHAHKSFLSLFLTLILSLLKAAVKVLTSRQDKGDILKDVFT